MDAFLGAIIQGVVTGAIYAIAASGLVVTYTTSGVFNFAHGAVGMICAFLYWQLRVDMGVPAPIAFVLVVAVAAPLLGFGIERGLMRGLSGASVTVSMVVTVGLMLLLIGIGQKTWDPNTPRNLLDFFAGKNVKVAGQLISYHQLIVLAFTAVVAGFLRFLLFTTRTGVAMRAVVDDRNLLSLNGGRPAQMGLVSWGLGSSLAALSGVLIAPTLQLQHINLTILVVNAYAGAMFGRLKSLPMTFAGSLLLGIASSFIVQYKDSLGPIKNIVGLNAVLPTLFLFALLLLTPEVRLRVGRKVGAKAPRVPTIRETLIAGGALVAVVALLAPQLSLSNKTILGLGLAFGVLFLSLVLLVGFGGQISLGQMTFAGIGLVAMAKLGGGGNLLGLLAAIVITAGVGALVALPALRLQGLYLALATLAFGKLMTETIFLQEWAFGTKSLDVPRLDLGPLSFDGDTTYVILCAVIFTGCAVAVLAIRRSRFGRLLFAMNDSPAACQTLGLNLTATKLGVFAVSAGMAGLAGVLYGGMVNVVSNEDVYYVQSLPVLLMAVIGGITTLGGALMGGLMYALLVRLGDPAVVFGVIGVVAVSLGRNPNGLAFFAYDKLGPVVEPYKRKVTRPTLPATPTTAAAPPMASVGGGGS